MNGLFITFEGGEGSGKSTVIKKIEEKLKNDGYKVIVSREPGGVKVSEDIRNVILDIDNKMEKETEALLYAASRVEHLHSKIIPLVDDGYIVLCDRYLDSSLAYQGVARGIGIEKVLDINMFAKEYMPIATYFFDVDPETGLSRIKGRDKIDRLDLETFDFHKKVYEGYKEIARMYPKRIRTIDGKREVNIIVNEIYNDILKLL